MGDLCLDVPNGNFVAGQTLQLWHCGNPTTQHWTAYDTTGSGSGSSAYAFMFHVTAAPSLCLAVSNGNATLQPCAGGYDANQLFDRWGGGQLRAQSTGYCLDVMGANPADGNPVWSYPCRTNSADSLQVAQLWYLRGPIHGLAGKCLDADGNTGNHNGTKTQLWDCNTNPQQIWEYHF